MARFGFMAVQIAAPTDELSDKGSPQPAPPGTSRAAMARLAGNTGQPPEPFTSLDPVGLTPTELQDNEFTRQQSDADAFGNDGTRTSQTPLSPGEWQEKRVMMAQRANPALNFTPGAVYENEDPQKGGAPGSPGGGNGFPAATNKITSQGPDGVTRDGAAPSSPLKLSYGWSDYMSHLPTFVGAHLKIQWNANPNKPQLNPTPFNTEGPSQNTRYSTPAPFAAGTYIG
jgi:hypothetical protein